MIDRKRLYSFAEAARLIASPHVGKPHLCLASLHRWRREGRFDAIVRRGPRGVRYFVWGSELMRLVPSPPEEESPETPAERRAQELRTLKRLEAQGFNFAKRR